MDYTEDATTGWNGWESPIHVNNQGWGSPPIVADDDNMLGLQFGQMNIEEHEVWDNTNNTWD